MTFKALLDEIKGNLDTVLSDMGITGTDFTVEPAKIGFGDASSNISFLVAKQLGQSPGDIATTISKRYQKLPMTLVSKSSPHPSGYVNFLADWAELSRLVLRAAAQPEFGDVDVGGGSVVVVEHTSVNPNKALHIGHVRNIVVGDSVSRILKKANYQVNVLNYVDDSGLQVADIIVGFKHLGFELEPPDGKKFDHYCGDDVYVKTTEAYEQDSSLADTRKRILSELENADSETARFGAKITRRVLACQLETCWNLSVYYDCLNFESQIVHSGLWSKTFEKLKGMSLVEYDDKGKNQGCWVVRGDKEEDKVLVRSNGTATYVAKDIPYAAWKLGLLDDPFGYSTYDGMQPPSRTLWQTDLSGSERPRNFSGEKAITVIDSRQARLQKIITSIMNEFKSAPESYVHLGYESVTLSPDTAKTLGLETGGKQAQMSGRKGLYVSADSVYDLLSARIASETKDRHPEMSDLEIQEISRDVTVGTIRYEMIKQDLDKIIVFDLSKSLSLEGDTASYIQYAHARASRILERSAQELSTDVDFSLLVEVPELNLIREIGLFDLRVDDAARNLSPKVISRYCHGLAVSFNSFYEKFKVLDIGDENLERSRLCLVGSFKTTIERALDLLGIAAPGRM